MNETEGVVLVALLRSLEKFRQRTVEQTIPGIPLPDLSNMAGLAELTEHAGLADLLNLHDGEPVKLVEEAERLASGIAAESAAAEEQPLSPGAATPNSSMPGAYLPGVYLEAVTHHIAIPRGEKQRNPLNQANQASQEDHENQANHESQVNQPNRASRGPRYYPLQPLNLFDASGGDSSGQQSSIFPVGIGEVESRSVSGGYERLWELFRAEAAQLPLGSAKAWLESLPYLMRKYAWCVPDGDRAGVSLYDHCRVTAAIAVCLRAARQTDLRDEPEFLLIEGSLSGIRRFIYHPAFNGRELRDGLASRLRGRSFYLTLIVKTLADHLVERLELCGLNVLWVTGGQFLILAPNTEQTRHLLSEARQEIEKWLWNESHGALGIVLADLALPRDQLRNFGPARQLLDQIRERMKLQQFGAPLGFADMPPDQAWEDPWALRMGQGICADTGRDLFEEDLEISGAVQSGEDPGERRAAPPTALPDRGAQSLFFETIGRALVGARTIQLRRSGDWPEPATPATPATPAAPATPVARLPRRGADAVWLKGTVKEVLIEFPALNRVWLLSGDLNPNPQADLCLRIADHRNKKIEFLRGNVATVAQGFELMATAVKTRKERGRESEKIAGFQELADRAEGAKYIGALRMDVDDLGYIFTQGMRNEESSIARIAALSQMLDWFFAGYLNTLVEGKDLYTAYAGGDDLSIVGAWDQVLDLAETIQHRFRNFCGNHPDLHISGAITLCPGRYPVGRAAEEAEEALDLIAKTNPQVFRDQDRRRHRIEGDSDKDALAFLEKKISWRKWREVRSLGDRLVKAYQSGAVSRQFVYHLLELYRCHIDPRRDPSREFAGEDLIWLPRFKFSLVRNVRDAQLRAHLIRAIEQNKYYLTILAGYVLLRTRGRHRKEDA